MAPNIVVVMTDSSRTDTYGCYAAPVARSPRVDRLAAEGVRFTEAHTQAPVCTPARASFLTGTHTPVHGCVENGTDRDLSLHTLPSLLEGAGYRTVVVGKTHFGGPDGFGTRRELRGEKNADAADLWAEHLEPLGYPRRSGWPNPVPEDDHCDSVLVDTAIDVLASARSSSADGEPPLFLLCSLPSPHSPLDPPGRWAHAYDDVALPPVVDPDGVPAPWEAELVGRTGVEDDGARRPDGTLDTARVDELRRRYLGLAAYCDDRIGRLLDAVDAAGLRESTLVVVTTDHGQQYWDHGFNDKHTFHDASWRIPLVMRWPGRIEPGSTGTWAMTSDVTATVLAAAGVESDAVQGFDLVGGGGERRYGAVSVLHRSLAVASRHWKLEYSPEHGRGRLWCRTSDPSELRDLWESPAHVGVRTVLLEALLGWRAELTDVQRLHEHTHGGGPVAERVRASTASRRGTDAEARLGERLARIDAEHGPEAVGAVSGAVPVPRVGTRP